MRISKWTSADIDKRTGAPSNVTEAMSMTSKKVRCIFICFVN